MTDQTPLPLPRLRVGSLFAGVGGFDLAAMMAGMDVKFWCEIDEHCRHVLATRFPHVPEDQRHDDVATLDPDLLPDIDVLVGGSPCQGFSVAGLGAGLDDPRSGLFGEFVRLIDALQPRGLKWVIWENVPGALTANKGKDIANVLAALATNPEEEARYEPVSLPRHPNGRTSRTSGLVDGPHRQLAWRILDAQHFGVAQRRRRLFAVVDLAGRRAGEVLLERQGMPGDPATGDEAGQEAPGEAGAGAGGSGQPGGAHVAGVAGTLTRGFGDRGASDPDRVTFVPEKQVASTIQASAGHHGHSSPRGDGSDNLAVEIQQPISGTIDAHWTPKNYDSVQAVSSGSIVPQLEVWDEITEMTDEHWTETANCLTARMGKGINTTVDEGQTPIVEAVEADPPSTFRKTRRPSSADDNEAWAEDSQANTLTTFDGAHSEVRATTVATFRTYPEAGQGADLRAVEIPDDGTHPALTSNAGQFQGDRGVQVVEGQPDGDDGAIPIDRRNSSRSGDTSTGAGTPSTGIGSPGDPSPSLPHHGATPAISSLPARWKVRRLTPLECERLQGFPDGWTEIDVPAPTGKQPDRLKPLSDTHRYKQMGNAVAVPCVGWILHRVVDADLGKPWDQLASVETVLSRMPWITRFHRPNRKVA